LDLLATGGVSMGKISQTELDSLARRDPLAWSITHVDLLDGKQWEIATRAWIKGIYQAVNPWEIERYPEGQARRLSIIKPTQIGMSTMAMARMLHFVTNWPARVMYTLPRQTDLQDLASTRLDPMIRASEYLRSKLGLPDSSHAKRLGDSFIYLAEMSVETRSVPIDMLLVDEVDLSDPVNVSTAMNRLDASRWKLNFFFSTPTVPAYGIHGVYLNSDMREWLVRCPKCSHEQPLDWEKNLRIMGAHNNPERVFYACEKCSTELTLEHIQTGRWVAQRPSLSSTHIGFHVTQMMTHPAPVLYAKFRDPQTLLIEFYRKSLGMPYEIGGGSLTRDDFLATCFDEPYTYEPAWDGQSTYYLGADQGNEIQVLIAKMEPGSRRKKIVHVELIPMEKGFDRLAQLMQIFKIRRAVIDGNPNRHDAKSLTKKFPGRIAVADYSDQKQNWKTRKDDDVKYINGVAINRTTGFDALIKSVKDGEWALPGEPLALHPDTELVIDHVTALKRDIESRRTPSGEVQVAVYRKLRADHLAHAWLYLKTAIEIDTGRGMKVAVIGADRDEPEESEEQLREKELAHIESKIIALLSEVPTEQLVGFINHKSDPDYVMPFPLSYKMGKAKDKYKDLDITLALVKLVASRASSRNKS
jgi:DNA-directed RNA polymerase subunit RPC12/RpoP